MVTTRSAERKINISGKEENLALRSKQDEVDLTEGTSETDVATPTFLRKKIKVLVNVPPPRKRSKLENDDTNDVEEVNLITNPAVSNLDVENRSPEDEIPDSQESPQKVDLAKVLKLEANDVVSGDGEQSSDPTPRIKRRRIGIEDLPSPEIPNKSGAISLNKTNEHNHSGSDDQKENEVDEDTDDAPEVVSTKKTSANSKQKRKARGKSIVSVKEALSEPSEALNGEAGRANSDMAKSKVSEATALPHLSIDTSQTPDTTLAPASEDSIDSAFVTARTTRHVDVFATPTGTISQMESPAGGVSNPTGEGLLMQQQPGYSTKTILTDPVTTRALKPYSTVIQPNVNSVTLPKKAGNSLEQFRQRRLYGEVEEGRDRSRGGRFKLREDWDRKRRKFVVGY